MVCPAAGFVDLAKKFGVRTLEVNLEPTGPVGLFDEVRRGSASEILPELVQVFLAGQA